MDANCFIEWMKPEAKRSYPKEMMDGIRELIVKAESGSCTLALSAFTLAETQYRGTSEEALEKYRQLLALVHPNVVRLDARLALQSAELGARLGLRGGDSVVLATAIHARARVLYTLDNRFLNRTKNKGPSDLYLLSSPTDKKSKSLPAPDGFKITKPHRESGSLL